jgi:hypothetical protein
MRNRLPVSPRDLIVQDPPRMFGLHMLRWLGISLGIVVWLGAISASAYLNYVAGLDLDAGGDKGKAIGAINVAADLWKGLCPVFVWVLWHNNRRPTAALLSLSWIAAFLYAMTNALGIVSERRGAWTEGREATRAAYESAAQELGEAEEKRRRVRAERTPAEVQAAIDAILARAVKDGDRIRGTVGVLSQHCDRPSARTVEACVQVQELRTDLASALASAGLDQRISELRTQVLRLRDRGGRLEVDPNARLTSRLTFGWISADDAPLMRLLLLALFIELVSAFLPVGLVEYARATTNDKTRHVATGRDAARSVGSSPDNITTLHHQPVGAVIDYVAERTEPAPETVALGVEYLYDDYASWCRAHDLAVASFTTFIDAFDKLREHPDVGQKVRKFGRRYYGIRIAAQAIAQLPRPRRKT